MFRRKQHISRSETAESRVDNRLRLGLGTAGMAGELGGELSLFLLAAFVVGRVVGDRKEV